MKLCSIWTNLSPHSLNSINKEEKEAVDLNCSYHKIVWNTGKETKNLYNEEIIVKTIKNYWRLIDASDFILWSTENMSPEKVDDPNNTIALSFSVPISISNISIISISRNTIKFFSISSSWISQNSSWNSV